MKLAWIAAGGAIGSVLRYLVGLLAQPEPGRSAFPFGTLIVNVVGCFVIGALSEIGEARGFLGANARAFVIVGLLGGFTTFSAFGNETVSAVRNGAMGIATMNVAANVILGLTAVWAGRATAFALWRSA
jgi:fluoride exporter